MTKQISNTKGKDIHHTTASAVGAVVGGVVGAAAAVALSDEKNRKKLMTKMKELKKYAGATLSEIEQMSDATTDIIEDSPSDKPIAAKQ